MILAVAAQFAWASAQVAPADRRMTKMELTATQLAHYMAPGVNLGNTMEACNWNDIFTNNAGLAYLPVLPCDFFLGVYPFSRFIIEHAACGYLDVRFRKQFSFAEDKVDMIVRLTFVVVEG